MSEKFPDATTANIIKFLEHQYASTSVMRRLKYYFRSREDKKFNLDELGKNQLRSRLSDAGVEDYMKGKVFTHFGFDTVKNETELWQERMRKLPKGVDYV